MNAKPPAVTHEGDDLILGLYIQTKACKDEVVGLYDGRLKVRITAPPIDGKANQHLIRYLSRCFEVPPSSIKLLQGNSNKRKKILVSRPKIIPDAFKL